MIDCMFTQLEVNKLLEYHPHYTTGENNATRDCSTRQSRETSTTMLQGVHFQDQALKAPNFEMFPVFPRVIIVKRN